MDDLGLKARIDDYTTISVSPIERETYDNYVGGDILGGEAGYFLIRSSIRENQPLFEVLAKSPTFAAAGELFDMIVSNSAALSAR